jgi:hypothetical protein
MINYISFILILCILLYIFLQPSYPEHFKNDFIVYIVWNDLINPYGLGDRLRGSVAIYQYCKSNNIKCVFDPRFSGFGNFLECNQSNNLNPTINTTTPVYQILTPGGSKSIKMFLDKKIDDQTLDTLVNNTIIESNSDETFKEFMNKIIRESKDGYVCVFSNLEAKLPLSNDDLVFFESITKVIPSLEIKIENIFNKLPYEYTIQHFRFSDSPEPSDDECEKALNLLKQNLKSTDILMSNSFKFKSLVKSNLNMFTLDCDECKSKNLHIAFDPFDSIIEFTLIEYRLITKACFIHTYSKYPWISNFVLWPAKFYSIPITNTQL